nr:TIR domain-containing protein [uncultured Chitinophaga sp.]
MPIPLKIVKMLMYNKYEGMNQSQSKESNANDFLIPPSKVLQKRIRTLIEEGEGFNVTNYAVFDQGIPRTETAIYMGWQAKVTNLLMRHCGTTSYAWERGMEADRFNIMVSPLNFEAYHQCKLAALYIALEEAVMKQGEDKTKKYEYDVTLSFAGEDRAYVDEIVSYLREYGLTYFYDKDEEVTLWGKDLYTYLDDVYRNRSRFCIVLISKYYKEKRWTKHEIKSAQARVFDENEGYILPVRLDDTEILGILPTIGYLDGRKNTPEQIAALIFKKVHHVE